MWYAVGVAFRNLLFSIGIKKSVSTSVPSIGVGNLRMGGTGKTPHTEYLIRHFSDYNTALLSRGYGRSTKGYVLADKTSDASQIGDEPAMMARKFPKITVAVCEKRVEGVEKLMQLPNPPEIILLDDVYQHRSIKPSLMLLLTEYGDPFFRDHILPFGNLREFRSGRRRADVVIVTKCPKELSIPEQEHYRKKLKLNNKQSLLFSYIDYQKPKKLYGEEPFENYDELLLVTGIANPKPLVKNLEEKWHVTHLPFPDHHDYTPADCKKIVDTFHALPAKAKAIVTTEKDAIRMMNPEVKEKLQKLPVFYIPIEIKFQNSSTFNTLVTKKILQ